MQLLQVIVYNAVVFPGVAIYIACQHHWRFPVLACNAKIAISCSEILQCNRVVLAAMLPPVIMGDLSMEPLSPHCLHLSNLDAQDRNCFLHL